MALFFDQQWLEAQLVAQGLSRDQLAERSFISRADLDLIIKDQMEVSAALVQKWALMFDVPAKEIANRCGVSTPIEILPSDSARISQLEARVTALEHQLLALTMRPNEGSR